MHGGLFSAFNPPLPPMTRPSLISIGQSCPIYFSRKLQMFCNLHNCTQGISTPLPSKTRGACTKLSRNLAMQMCQKVQRAILDHFMTVTLDKWNPAGRVACIGKGRVQHLHTRLHRRGQRPIRRVVQELPCNHWTTGYSNLPWHTYHSRIRGSQGEILERKQRRTRYSYTYARYTTLHKNRSYPHCFQCHVCWNCHEISRCKDDKQDHLRQVVAPYKVSKDQGSHVNKSNP